MCDGEPTNQAPVPMESRHAGQGAASVCSTTRVPLRTMHTDVYVRVWNQTLSCRTCLTLAQALAQVGAALLMGRRDAHDAHDHGDAWHGDDGRRLQLDRAQLTLKP